MTLPRIPWNLCTTFAAIGVLLACLILVPIFGFYWAYLATAVVGMLSAYAISTAFGNWAQRVQLGRFLVRSIFAGIGIAIATLLFAALGLGISMFLVEVTRELLSAPSGQPFWNAIGEFAPRHAEGLIVAPVAAALLFGVVPATVLGFVYGVLLHNRSDSANASGSAVRKWLVGGLAGTFMVLGLITALWFAIFASDRWSRAASVPFAIGGCGSTRVDPGVLAYCFGHPCEGDVCDWENRQHVFAAYVEPPAGGPWTWNGGGLGTTRRRDVVQHNLYWMQKGPDGNFDESDPHRYVNYQIRFQGDDIEIGGYLHQFEPGMLIVIKFADDWSFNVDVGAEAVKSAVSSPADLQRALDEICEQSTSCDAPFQIQGSPTK